MGKLFKKSSFLYVVVGVIAVTVLYLVILRPAPAEEETQSIGDLDADATEIVDKSQLPPESETISVPAYPAEIPLANGQSTTAIELSNPEENTVYFKFTIALGEKDGENFQDTEILYESGLVQPGQAVYSQELNRALITGTYDASIIIQTYSMLTEEEMNGARTLTQFIVE